MAIGTVLTAPSTWAVKPRSYMYDVTSTYLGPLPLNLNRNFLAEIQWRVSGREVWVLKQDPLLKTLLPELLEGFPAPLSALSLDGAGAPAGQGGLQRHLLQLEAPSTEEKKERGELCFTERPALGLKQGQVCQMGRSGLCTHPTRQKLVFPLGSEPVSLSFGLGLHEESSLLTRQQEHLESELQPSVNGRLQKEQFNFTSIKSTESPEIYYFRNKTNYLIIFKSLLLELFICKHNQA